MGPRELTQSSVDDVQQRHFQPFQEVAPELTHVSHTPAGESYARLDYHPEAEAGVNEQINVQLGISYAYLALHAYADRDNVGLPGHAGWFWRHYRRQWGHAQRLLTFQNKRGGQVQLHTIGQPAQEFAGEPKWDAQHMMEVALSLYKLSFRRLRLLHDIAVKHDDAEMADFLESKLLHDHAVVVKETAVHVSQLRRVGQGLGVFEFDKYLGDQGGGESNGQ